MNDITESDFDLAKLIDAILLGSPRTELRKLAQVLDARQIDRIARRPSTALDSRKGVTQVDETTNTDEHPDVLRSCSGDLLRKHLA